MHLHLVALAWMFVVVLMFLAEGTSPQGTWLGAFFTLLLYGLMPLSILLYVLGTPARRRALRQQEQAAASAAAPDGRGHAPGDTVPPERIEP